MARLILFTFFAFYLFKSEAQNFGGFPSKTKWRQINTDTARIIFTPAASDEAQRVATIINEMAARSNTLGNRIRKINVLLQSNTTLANGYVALGPFRSEFYLVPGGNIFEFGNLPWQEQLAVHEYRHVQQYNNFNRGGSRVAGILFGQEGRALANAIAVPDWFFEGDAVYAESILTPQGRGRMPYFHNGFKSLWREGRDYNWMKLRNGSLKDYVPNHYQLGYLLVNYGYLKYGEDFWGKVTADASAYKTFPPFQQSLKKHAGIPFRTFRSNALQFYKHEVSKRRIDEVKRETVTNYYFAQQIGSDSILYLKNSYKRIPAFYLKTGNKEYRIKQKSIGSEEWFSYRNGLIAYTAYNTNARWSLIDYNDIVILDMQTGKEQWLTHNGKYYSPDLAPDNASVVAVSVTDSIKTELHQIDRQGTITRVVKAPAHTFFMQPRFIDSSSVVVVVRWPDAKVSLEQIDLATGQFKNLTPRTNATVGNPYIRANTVYFTSSLTGNDEVYSLSLKDRQVQQLTSGQSGKYFITALHDTLLYSRFTSNGFRYEHVDLQNITPSEVNLMMWGESTLPFPIANVEAAQNILAAKTKNFPETKYRKATGLFNFHSWRPDYEDPEFTFTLFSNNILNTFSNQLYYRYNQNERSNAVGFTALYGGWFPMIRAGVEHTNNRHIRRQNQNTIVLSQTEANVGYNIPLNFTRGKTYKIFNVGTRYFLTDVRPTTISRNSLTPFQTSYLSHAMSFTQQLPMARQHIYPKAGYSISANYRHRLGEEGYQHLYNSSLFLPSAFANHSLVLNGSFQQTDTSNVIFTNRFANSRGYSDYYFSRMWKLSANYHMPLFYPDIGVANLVYLLRMRTNIFYDYSRMYSNDKERSINLRSVGTELYFDTKWWNSLPLTIGVRYSYLLDANLVRATNRNVFEIIFPMDLIPN